MNRNKAFFRIAAIGVVFLLVAVFGIINETYTVGPYRAEVSDKNSDYVQVSIGTNHTRLIIPDLPQTVVKGTKAEIFTTSLAGKGKNLRKALFYDDNNVLICSWTLPVSSYIISTSMIFLVFLIFAIITRVLPQELLYRKNYAFPEDEVKDHPVESVENIVIDNRFRLIVSLFALYFFFSGFCGLLYQTVWLRLAFSHFGVITPVVSVVVSTFMFGLGFGTWLAGRLVSKVTDGKLNAVTLYGLVEAIIGCGAIIVPIMFAQSSRLLLNTGESNSAWFLSGSGLCIALSLLPFSIAMGATYPLALRAYEQLGLRDHHRFGVLYAFNTAGAVAGCMITVFVLIELIGFRNTLYIGAVLNFTIALSAVIYGILKVGRVLSTRQKYDSQETSEAPKIPGVPAKLSAPYDLVILFTTGFCSMAAEVVWIRVYGPKLEQAVYAFGFLLISYLIGHALGAWTYHLTVNRFRILIKSALLIAAALSCCLSVAVANANWMHLIVSDVNSLRLYMAIAIGTFAAVLGWLTPLLVDRYSKSNPHAAGNAYAINIAGCVIGPLISGYFLVPLLGAQHSLIILSLPLIALMFLERRMMIFKLFTVCLSALILIPALYCHTWEEQVIITTATGTKKVYRDYAATTILYSAEKGWKEVIVNGHGMTTLSPITKLMADLPMALHKGQADDVLVICLGLGTTYKTALTWGANVTAVELVPGVVKAFMDDNRDFNNPRGRIIIDDGRRFLRRTREKFDIIIIDPPPPAEQPTSSLLSSTEFYSLLKEHLKPGGIVQAWYGHIHAEPAIGRAFTQSLKESFSHIKIYRAIDDYPFQSMWGLHFICSDEPVPDITTEEFLRKLPAEARQDLKDMFFYVISDEKMEAMVSELLSRKIPIEKLLLKDPSEKITDDRPFNEYFLIRRYRDSIKKNQLNTD